MRFSLILIAAVLLLPTAALAAELPEEWHSSHAEAVTESGGVVTTLARGSAAHTKIESDATDSDFTQELHVKNMIHKVCLATAGSAVVLSFTWIPGGKADVDAKTHTVIEATLDATTPCAYNLSAGTYYADVTTNASVADAILSVVTYKTDQ